MSDDLLRPGWRATKRAVNGVTLHVVEAGREGDPVVILLHGFPEFWWAWRHQIGPLADAGFHVVAPDMRGYNESDAPPAVADYRLDTLAADVVALADAVGATRFHLVGHDWGAVVGWRVAVAHADRLERVVLMDGPHPDVLLRQALTHPTQALRSTYVAFFQLPWLPEATLGAFGFAGLKAAMRGSARADAFEPGALDRYARAWARPGALTAMLNYYRALRLRPSAGAPARITPPTLVLWGERDQALELRVADASVALCDRGRLTVVPGATHWLHLEESARVTAEIIGFLAA